MERKFLIVIESVWFFLKVLKKLYYAVIFIVVNVTVWGKIYFSFNNCL